MPYSAEISRINPTCLLFLVDQSGSMSYPFRGKTSGQSKAQGVADVINRLLQNLALKCAKSEGIRDYFYVGVIGYGGNRVQPAFQGDLAGRPIVAMSDLVAHPVRIEQRSHKMEDSTGALIEQSIKFPVWLEPTAGGKTPMCGALTLARHVVAEFVERHPGCYPPMVVNITDGAATDGTPEVPANELRTVASTDGNTLLFNVHLSSKALRPIEYPDSEVFLPDDYARLLFRMSSVLPPKVQAAARVEGFLIGDSSRGFVFNADLVAVIHFMDIGTKMGPVM
jgi:hypothetical protein